MFFSYLVTSANITRDLARRFTSFQTTPHKHCCLVQRVVALGIEIDEHRFTTVELGVDNVAVWLWRSRGIQGCLSSNMIQSLVVAGATITGSERASTA